MNIPRALFDDLEKLDHVLLASSTCSCFVSVDARLPTALARVHLEYLQQLGRASRIDLRRFAGVHSTWLSSVLPRERDRLRLINFPGELPAFLTASAVPDDFRCKLERLTRDLSFMLAIEERVNRDNRERRIRLFRLGVQVLERRAALRGVANPIGRLATRAEFSEASRAYLLGESQPSVPFHQYKLMLTSQLRVLYELALAFVGIDADTLGRLNDADRDWVLDRLEVLILQGITVPAHERSEPSVCAFLDGITIDEARASAPLFDGSEAWLSWVRHSARGPAQNRQSWLTILARLPTGYEDTNWKLLRALSNSDLEVVRALTNAHASGAQNLSI